MQVHLHIGEGSKSGQNDPLTDDGRLSVDRSRLNNNNSISIRRRGQQNPSPFAPLLQPVPTVREPFHQTLSPNPLTR
jgi:hypothetical protein